MDKFTYLKKKGRTETPYQGDYLGIYVYSHPPNLFEKVREI